MNPHRIPTPSSDDAAARLLVAFLSGDTAAQNKFVRLYGPKVLTIAKRVAGDLASSGQAEDVVGVFWMLLLKKTPDYFGPSPFSVWTHISPLIRTAAAKVRSQNQSPFQAKDLKRTVAGKDAIAENKAAAANAPAERPPVQLPQSLKSESIEAVSETTSATPFARGDYTDRDFQIAERKIDVHHLLQRVNNTAKPYVRQSLALMYDDHLSIVETARKMNVTHWQLRRDIDRWVRQQELSDQDYI